MEMGVAGGNGTRNLRLIGGVIFLLLALVFTFAIPLTIAVEDMDMLVSTGDQNLEPVGQQLDIGKSINGYAQEFTVNGSCEVEAVVLRIGTMADTDRKLLIGIADDITMDKEQMIVSKDLAPFQQATQDTTFDLPTAILESNRTYYLIVVLPPSEHNMTPDRWQYHIENTEAEYSGDTYKHSWDYVDFFGTPWIEETLQTYGGKDVWLELYGFWIDEDGDGVEDEEEPAWIDNQTAGIMILWVGSIFAGLGGGMLLTLMPEIEQRPWIALVGGMAIFLGWFFMIANPWMLITMVPAIVRW